MYTILHLSANIFIIFRKTMVSVQLSRMCVLVPLLFVISIIFLANDMLEDANTGKDRATTICKETKIDQVDIPIENSDKDPELEIVFLRRRSKLDHKLREAAEDALKFENHK